MKSLRAASIMIASVEEAAIPHNSVPAGRAALRRGPGSGSPPAARLRAARAATLILLLSSPLIEACRGGERTAADRILERHRREQQRKPLPPSGSIRIRLSPPSGGPPAEGSVEIEWEGSRYRETVSSSGVTTVLGIQEGKAFYTDEDGVTRVGSEPILADLITRSYFWRRAYLFDDLERASFLPLPAGSSSETVLLRPRGGNSLRLNFSGRDARLVSAVAPRFRLEFESVSTFRDLSRGDRSSRGEIIWAGLPTRRLPDPEVGGGRARFDSPVTEVPYEEIDGRIAIPARVSGASVRLAIDASADGPLAVAPREAGSTGLAFSADAFGRQIASGASLEIGRLRFSPLHVRLSRDRAAGTALAGGILFREAVVEIDAGRRVLRLHDPERWVVPEGFFRVVLDDDGNRPVAILTRAGRPLRLRAGVGTQAALLLAPETAGRLGLSSSRPTLEGLRLGAFALPPLPALLATSGYTADWGDEGAVGFPLLLRFHSFLDMPHRWIYLKPEAGLMARDERSNRRNGRE